MELKEKLEKIEQIVEVSYTNGHPEDPYLATAMVAGTVVMTSIIMGNIPHDEMKKLSNKLLRRHFKIEKLESHDVQPMVA